jgi:hypothetical protein
LIPKNRNAWKWPWRKSKETLVTNTHTPHKSQRFFAERFVSVACVCSWQVSKSRAVLLLDPRFSISINVQ